LQELGDIEK